MRRPNVELRDDAGIHPHSLSQPKILKHREFPEGRPPGMVPMMPASVVNGKERRQRSRTRSQRRSRLEEPSAYPNVSAAGAAPPANADLVASAVRADSATPAAGAPAVSASVVNIESRDRLDSIVNRVLDDQLSRTQNGMHDRSAPINDNHCVELEDGSVMRLKEPIADIKVTSEQFKHFRDTWVRADMALLSARTHALELLKTLHDEQFVVRDAAIALKRISQSARSRRT